MHFRKTVVILHESLNVRSRWIKCCVPIGEFQFRAIESRKNRDFSTRFHGCIRSCTKDADASGCRAMLESQCCTCKGDHVLSCDSRQSWNSKIAPSTLTRRCLALQWWRAVVETTSASTLSTTPTVTLLESQQFEHLPRLKGTLTFALGPREETRMEYLCALSGIWSTALINRI